eukprot:gnl/MRDRNA2_/MRDRNA2_168868_c0_seq1.p1 gnl/MRDRNA2_/MRDRNA2_168868_c0~~gnl/MRDRNA2_/MRDRNA2_168868_c0_seq1.p1  ORF type:complete len:409 (+),score=74.35 gnl/MRDRNA2_/MRDRNA2_168868_c0_seq1:137-1363(+)
MKRFHFCIAATLRVIAGTLLLNRAVPENVRDMLFGGSDQSAQFEGFKDVYIDSGDPLGELLHNILSIVRAHEVHLDNFVSVVGSFSAVNLLTSIEPRNIVFFDMNPAAIEVAKLKCELINISDTPQDYISRIFARNVSSFEQAEGRLTKHNQHVFLGTPVDEELRTQTKALLTGAAKDIYESLLQQYQDPDFEDESMKNAPGTMQPCEDRTKLKGCTMSGLGGQHIPMMNKGFSFRYGDGFLSSERTYSIVRRKLQTLPITWIAGVDFPASDAMFGREDAFHGNRTLLFVMDMFSSGFAADWTPDRIEGWRQAVGQDALILMQTITRTRSDLVQKYATNEDGEGHWVSLSHWESSYLMPEILCEIPGGRVYCDGNGNLLNHYKVLSLMTWAGFERTVSDCTIFKEMFH